MNIPVTDLKPTSSQFEIGVKTSTVSKDDEKIFCRSWGDAQSPYVSVLVHGLGAHSGWFEPLASRLANSGHLVYSFDLAGFGNSSCREIDNYKKWSMDLVNLVEHIEPQLNSRPLILIGNSMGALVLIAALSEIRVSPSAIAIFSPGFGGCPKTFTLGYKVRAILTALFNPKKIIDLPYGVEEITSNPNIRAQLKEDPLAKFSIPAGLGLELLKLTKFAIKESKTLPCPLFMATASEEYIVDNKENDRFFKETSAPVKKKNFYKGSYHDLIFEPSLPSMVEDLNDWLKNDLSI